MNTKIQQVLAQIDFYKAQTENGFKQQLASWAQRSVANQDLTQNLNQNISGMNTAMAAQRNEKALIREQAAIKNQSYF